MAGGADCSVGRKYFTPLAGWKSAFDQTLKQYNSSELSLTFCLVSRSGGLFLADCRSILSASLIFFRSTPRRIIMGATTKRHRRPQQIPFAPKFLVFQEPPQGPRGRGSRESRLPLWEGRDSSAARGRVGTRGGLPPWSARPRARLQPVRASSAPTAFWPP